MNKILLSILLFCATTTIAQKHINFTLKRQLDSVMMEDQKYRGLLTQLMVPAKQDSVAKSLGFTWGDAMTKYSGLQNGLDSLNVVFIEKVFSQYGYPGKTLVDTPANESAWYIIQHSKKISEYIPIMKKAADQNELPYHLYAMMLDRDLMNQGKEQIYGTQGGQKALKNGKGGYYIWPIHDVAHVNERRKKAGFNSTVEQNAARMGITYMVVKLNDVK
jgi:hypothetical protein